MRPDAKARSLLTAYLRTLGVRGKVRGGRAFGVGTAGAEIGPHRVGPRLRALASKRAPGWRKTVWVRLERSGLWRRLSKRSPAWRIDAIGVTVRRDRRVVPQEPADIASLVAEAITAAIGFPANEEEQSGDDERGFSTWLFADPVSLPTTVDAEGLERAFKQLPKGWIIAAAAGMGDVEDDDPEIESVGWASIMPATGLRNPGGLAKQVADALSAGFFVDKYGRFALWFISARASLESKR